MTAGPVSSRSRSSKERCAMEPAPDLPCYPSIEVRVRRVKRRSNERDTGTTMNWSTGIRRSAWIVVGVSLTTVAVSVFHWVSSSANQYRRQMQLENRHPLSVAATTQRRRQLRAADKSTTRYPTNSKLRYLSFGSSNTWGIGMDHRSPLEFTTPTLEAEEATSITHSTAYPNLLDANVLTVALPSSREYADLAAACTQSLVEGGAAKSHATQFAWSPDVITVEYSHDLTPSHVVLLQRLRRRYPNAIRVLVQLFQPPTQLVLHDANRSTGSTQTLQSWWQAQQTATPLNVDSLARYMSLATQGSSRWTGESTAQTLAQRVEQLVRDDPLLLHYTGLSATSSIQTEDEWSAYLRLFADDTLNDLSAVGHARVATEVQALVDAKRSVAATVLTHEMNHGSWGSGDECKLWYANGNYQSLESTAQRVDLPWDATHKHVLEFSPVTTHDAGTSVDRPNQITVSNPFATDRLLSLTYLTDADGMTYPRTRVVLNGVPTLEVQPIHVSSASGSLGNDIDQRYTRTTGVGYIPPGISTVRLDPLQSTLLPFRLLGASLLAEEVQGLNSIEFSLETDA